MPPQIKAVRVNSQASYKPTRLELAAIRKGETAIALGDCVTLAEFLRETNRSGRKTPAIAAR